MDKFIKIPKKIAISLKTANQSLKIPLKNILKSQKTFQKNQTLQKGAKNFIDFILKNSKKFPYRAQIGPSTLGHP